MSHVQALCPWRLTAVKVKANYSDLFVPPLAALRPTLVGANHGMDSAQSTEISRKCEGCEALEILTLPFLLKIFLCFGTRYPLSIGTDFS